LKKHHFATGNAGYSCVGQAKFAACGRSKDVLPESSQFYIVEHQEFTSLTHVILPSLGSQAIACPRASKKLAGRRFARQGVSDGPKIQLEFETFGKSPTNTQQILVLYRRVRQVRSSIASRLVQIRAV